VREIYKAYQCEGGKEGKIHQIKGRNAVTHEENNGEKPHEELYKGITPGNWGMTCPAFSPQKSKAYQGNIVVKTDRCLTVRAVRRRQDNGSFLWNPMDADVKKAPNNGPKNKAEKKRYPVHPNTLPFSLSRLR
jgi:hypothetical protein